MKDLGEKGERKRRIKESHCEEKKRLGMNFCLFNAALLYIKMELFLCQRCQGGKNGNEVK